MNLKNLLLITALFAAAGAQAQISYGGSPIGFDAPERTTSVEFVSIPSLNVEALIAEDEILDQHKDIPYRFGENIPVLLTMNDGHWMEGPKGERLWQLGIESPGAMSINFMFSTFNIPEGARLFVYDADRTHYIGSFTHQNMQPHGGLAVSLIQSDRIIIEYIEPANVAGQGVLEIDNITHGYRSVLNRFEDTARGPFGNSGSCNINVVCPEGIGWEDQIRSVAIIVSNGNAVCSGSLVNNTAEDGTPYFLTANHCLGGNINNWMFYFNHQSTTCGGNNGPTNQSVSGAVLRASNSGSDVALLELNQAPPESFNVYYNGWDRTGNIPTSQTGIHHPAGDVKKITHDFDAATQSVNAGSQNWYINNWEQGTTEGGSSGSPLFDQNGRVIGQLYGGVASCSNPGGFDYYGRFDVSWNGSSASNRLSDWLDPIGSNVTILDGLGGTPAEPNDAAAFGISEVDEVMCNASTITPVFTLRNAGTETLTSAVLDLELNLVNVGTINWSGSLESGETEAIELPEMTLINGENMLVVTVSEPNGQEDTNPANNSSTKVFTAFADSESFEVVIVMDNYGSETSWDITNEFGSVLFSGNNYAQSNPWGNDGTNGQVVGAEVCLGVGCYTFTIYDSYGDGICCNYGNGSYSLINGAGETVGSGGNFGNSESVDFCVETVSVTEIAPFGQIRLFPNPVQSVLTLQADAALSGVATVTISDITGRVFYNEEISGLQNQTFDVSGWAAGMYLLSISSGDHTIVERFVISK